MSEDTEVLDTPNMGIVPEIEPLVAEPKEYSFVEYTQEISDDLVVTTYGDSIVVDKSGPFDTRENAETFAASFKSGLESGDIKPLQHVVEGN